MGKERPSFKQQNLPAWQPILTAGTILPTFFLIGVAFVPIGIGLFIMSQSVQEIVIDYTDCTDSNGKACSDSIKPSLLIPYPDCVCEKDFELHKDYKYDLFVYYGLTNFYQNHRRYVKSRDDYQLLGHPQSASSECYPFKESKGIPIAPCGAIANSLFNDTFTLKIKGPRGQNLDIQTTGIAWPSDKGIRFKNPDGELTKAFANTTKPPNWPQPVSNMSLYPTDNGFQHEHLIVWMRTAALPTFRKLWGIVRNQDNSSTQKSLPKGRYTLIVNYRYPVVAFGARKRFILSNTSWLGGRNHFLGIAYIIVGCICFSLSALFLFIHRKYGKLSTEIIQINQSTPYLT